MFGDELPAETVQPTRGCTPEELKKGTADICTTIAQQENLAAKGILGVRVSLRFSSDFV